MSVRRYVLDISQTLAPGEKTIVYSASLGHDFELDWVIVPDDVTYDEKATKLLFHHECLAEKKAPASLALNFETVNAQRVIYPKRHFRKGEVVTLGTFENVSSEPLLMRAAIIGAAFVGAGN